jgi:hypothetical protein
VVTSTVSSPICDANANIHRVRLHAVPMLFAKPVAAGTEVWRGPVTPSSPTACSTSRTRRLPRALRMVACHASSRTGSPSWPAPHSSQSARLPRAAPAALPRPGVRQKENALHGLTSSRRWCGVHQQDPLPCRRCPAYSRETDGPWRSTRVRACRIQRNDLAFITSPVTGTP